MDMCSCHHYRALPSRCHHCGPCDDFRGSLLQSCKLQRRTCKRRWVGLGSTNVRASQIPKKKIQFYLPQLENMVFISLNFQNHPIYLLEWFWLRWSQVNRSRWRHGSHEGGWTFTIVQGCLSSFTGKYFFQKKTECIYILKRWKNTDFNSIWFNFRKYIESWFQLKKYEINFIFSLNHMFMFSRLFTII